MFTPTYDKCPPLTLGITRLCLFLAQCDSVASNKTRAWIKFYKTQYMLYCTQKTAQLKMII